MLGSSTLVLGLTSHGWYLYYVFEQMGQHALNTAAETRFWTGYLLPTLGLACCAAVLGARRVPLVLVAGCAALVVEGYAARVQIGGNVNDMLPAYLAVALLAGLAMAPGPAASRPARPGRPGTRTRAEGRLGAGRPPRSRRWSSPSWPCWPRASARRQAIPTVADRVAGQRLAAGLRVLGGTVALPGDPGLALHGRAARG